LTNLSKVAGEQRRNRIEKDMNKAREIR
jgi:hypothetical protein